jgi:hypothetical protein
MNRAEEKRWFSVTADFPKKGSPWGRALGGRHRVRRGRGFGGCGRLECHQQDASSPHAGIHSAYLFDSSADAFDPYHATRVGYTHLIGDAKSHHSIAERLERRVQSDYPEHYERCLRHLRQSAGPARD